MKRFCVEATYNPHPTRRQLEATVKLLTLLGPFTTDPRYEMGDTVAVTWMQEAPDAFVAVQVAHTHLIGAHVRGGPPVESVEEVRATLVPGR